MSPSPAVFLLSLCVICFFTSVAMTAVRLRDPRQIVRETVNLFVTVLIGILALCVVVWILEWIFIRPLL